MSRRNRETWPKEPKLSNGSKIRETFRKQARTSCVKQFSKSGLGGMGRWVGNRLLELVLPDIRNRYGNLFEICE